MDPAGQKYPAEHGLVHWSVVRAEEDPKRPAAQGPEHAGVVRPVDEPKVPKGQAVQVGAPAREYCPVPQMDCVALVEPAGHE